MATCGHGGAKAEPALPKRSEGATGAHGASSPGDEDTLTRLQLGDLETDPRRHAGHPQHPEVGGLRLYRGVHFPQLLGGRHELVPPSAHRLHERARLQ